MSKFLQNLMTKVALVQSQLDPRAQAIAASIPVIAAAGMGGIGGALSPRGSGLIPGALRGAGAGLGFDAGVIGGQAAGQALDKDHPNLAIAARAGLPLLGGYLGYRGAKALTKTREEELREAMLRWYGDDRNYGDDAPPEMASGPLDGEMPVDQMPKLASKIPVHILRIERILSRHG